MKVVFNAVQMGHKPQRYLSKGKLVHYPEQPERVKRLLRGARKAGAELHAAKSHSTKLFSPVHSRRYVEFLEHGHDQWMAQGGAHEEMMPSVRPTPGVVTYSEHIMAKAGWHLSDFSCPMVFDTWRVVKASADTALTAAAMVEGGEKVVYALCRPPGHHAQTERAGGFCYLNNAALVASRLRDTHERVAILDIDVHHGNGTQQIFYRRNDVLTVSVHADPDQLYPYYQGQAAQTGMAEGEGFNLNLPVPVKSDNKVWQQALVKALGRISEFDPGVLVVALGLDAHEADPLDGGNVTTQGFAEMAVMIGALGLPTVLVQEGGYLTPYLGDNLASFLIGYETSIE